jgi:hypothetical protein
MADDPINIAVFTPAAAKEVLAASRKGRELFARTAASFTPPVGRRGGGGVGKGTRTGQGLFMINDEVVGWIYPRLVPDPDDD